MNPAETAPMSDAPPGHSSAGQLMRKAREARGMHLAMLSVALKVPVRKLEALERDDHSGFKDIAFLRALSQAVCRHVGMDPAPVLAALPPASSSLPRQQPPHEARLKPSPIVSGPVASGRNRFPSRLVLLLALLMLAASAALIWWPATTAGTARVSVAGDDASVVAVPLGQASNPVDWSAPAMPADTASAAEVSTPAQPPTREQPGAGVTSSPAPGSAAMDNALLLRATLDTWVEVRDRKGQLLVKQLVKAGESLRQETEAPFFIYISQAEGTELQWQGRALDLKPHTKNNEARLKVKP